MIIQNFSHFLCVRNLAIYADSKAMIETLSDFGPPPKALFLTMVTALRVFFV